MDDGEAVPHGVYYVSQDGCDSQAIAVRIQGRDISMVLRPGFDPETLWQQFLAFVEEEGNP